MRPTLPPARDGYRLTTRGTTVLTLLIGAMFLLVMGIVGGIEAGTITLGGLL